MRTIALVAALSASAAIAGCGTLVERDGNRYWCRDKEVNVINRPSRFQVKPDPVKMCRGYTVVLRLERGVPERQAGTSSDEVDWMTARNMNMEEIVIRVPDDATPNEDGYKYTVAIEGYGVLDPRIVVQ